MTREEEDLIIAKQNKSREEILKAITKVELYCQELFNLKNMRIEELEQEKCELLGIIQEKDKAIKKLIADMAGLEEENEQLRNNGFTVSAMTEQQLKVAIEKGEQLEKQLEQAKRIIKNLLILNNDHYGNTKIEWRVEVTEQAEQFLKEHTL